MKVLLFALTTATCLVLGYGGQHPDGESQVSRSQDALGNYHFSYKVANEEGEQFREEGTDTLGRVIGSYGLKHVDGSHRVVDYVADQNGFRASVRSNENGLSSAEGADLTIVKTDQHIPLSVAATSDDESRHVFGRRIEADASKVEYVDKDSKDEEAKEQRNFDDYRPLNPVAYYPSDFRSNPSSVEQSRSSRKLSNSEADSKPLDVYLPPIDPHTAARRPPYYVPRDRTSVNSFPTTTSRKPYIPPYGGFDDDDDDPIPPVERNPSIGLRPDHITPSPPLVNTARRFPPIEHRNFDIPRFPPSSLHPRPPISSLPPQSLPAPAFIPQNPPVFNPPSYDGRIGAPTVVLHAVPIPNGIQAVRIDPSTGRIYERLVYPLYLRHDGRPEYDRNILLHNDDVSDDDELRHDDPGYLDMPFPRGPFRGVRNQPPYGEDGRRFRNNSYNQSNRIDITKLSEPSAADISWIMKQLALVEGFEKDHFSDRFLPNHISSFPDRDHFDEEHGPSYDRRVPSSRIRSYLPNYASETDFARDDLAPIGSKIHSAKLKEDDGSTSQADGQKAPETQ